jgi:regulator of nucleoside diphosphate kinase
MKAKQLPPITLTEENHRVLSDMADAAMAGAPVLAEFLSQEIDRARLVPSDGISPDVVTLGSSVRFRERSSGATRSVRLVLPSEANIANGRLSILTPVGIALIGLSAGQEMEWETRDGRTLGLTLLDVAHQPEAETYGRARRGVTAENAL